MKCLNCGCNQFSTETDKLFFGNLAHLTDDPPDARIVACSFCGDSFLKLPHEAIHEAYARYIKNTPAR